MKASREYMIIPRNECGSITALLVKKIKGGGGRWVHWQLHLLLYLFLCHICKQKLHPSMKNIQA